MDNDLLELDYSENIDISGSEEVVRDLSLDSAQTDISRVYGRVTLNEEAFADATVKVFDISGKPFSHTVTDYNGNYSIQNLPTGVYSIVVSKPGYRATDRRKFTVTEGTDTKLDLTVLATSAISFGTITGRVVDKNGNFIVDATVTILDGTLPIARTKTIDSGEYVLYDLPNGNYTICVTKNGYVESTEEKAVITDSIKIVNKDIILTLNEDAITGTINGIIYDNAGAPVADAFVGLYLITVDATGKIITEILQTTTLTNSNGEYMFGMVPAGKYIVKAKKNMV